MTLVMFMCEVDFSFLFDEYQVSFIDLDMFSSKLLLFRQDECGHFSNEFRLIMEGIRKSDFEL